MAYTYSDYINNFPQNLAINLESKQNLVSNNILSLPLTQQLNAGHNPNSGSFINHSNGMTVSNNGELKRNTIIDPYNYAGPERLRNVKAIKAFGNVLGGFGGILTGGLIQSKLSGVGGEDLIQTGYNLIFNQ